VSTIKALLTEFRGFSDHVIKPVYHGRAGHPVVLPEHLFPIIQRAPGGTTLREVLGQTGVQVRYVDVDDGGVLVNVNTPADLR
jgi:molybdenum cofactor cytidylyltransferase